MAEKPKDMAGILATIRQSARSAAADIAKDPISKGDNGPPNDTSPYLLATHYRVAPKPVRAPEQESNGPLLLLPSRRIGFDEDAPTRPGRTSAGLSLDQAELQQMVAELVKEELRGALGEQFTLNMRKLVRQEMEMAMDRKPETDE